MTKEIKERVSVRVLPSIYLKIVKKYGSFSNFVNKAIELLILGGK